VTVHVKIKCEECGHINEVDVEVDQLPVSEPIEDGPMRGYKPLPISEPLDEEE
jgi:hypothetical protein